MKMKEIGPRKFFNSLNIRDTEGPMRFVNICNYNLRFFKIVFYEALHLIFHLVVKFIEWKIDLQ